MSWPRRRNRKGSPLGTIVRCVLPAALLLAGAPIHALTLGQVRVEGVEGEVLDNVLATLELVAKPPQKPFSEATLAYQLRTVPAQVAQAVEPYGYYDTDVEVSSQRDGEQVSVLVSIDLGEPVRIGEASVRMGGDGADDPVLAPLLRNFVPKPGDVLDHQRYDSSKADVQRTLQARGYFRSRLQAARVEVRRSERRADIDLAWDSGPRHLFGATRFEGSQLRPDLLQPLVPYTEGQPYNQAGLLKLHAALVELDYFGLIDIQPQLRPRRGDGPATDLPAAAEGDAATDEDFDEAESDGPPPSVPIAVQLTPAKRSRYTAGLGYGTDNGASVRVGLDRRWVNDRGHKIKADAELGQRRSQVGVQYRIPEFAWLPGWWTAGIAVRDEEIADSRSEIGTFSVARNGRWRGNQVTFEINVQQERFERFDDPLGTRRDTLLVYPSLRMDRVVADDLLYPTRGYSLSAYVRSGSQAIGSDVDFAQVGASAKWVRALGGDYRLLLRGEAATTWVDDFPSLPPSLRNYAGGDRSVRGYGYQELGPIDSLGKPVGGKHLLVASAELERRIAERWAVALFADAGNAFDGSDFRPAIGVGLGLRWRSPVGPVRLDVGHGLDDPRQALRIHFSIGPEL